MYGFGPARYRPLTSGPPPEVPPEYMQAFLQSIQPVVVSNEETLSVSSADPFESGSPMVEVLQVTLPVMAPVTLVLEPRPTQQQFSLIEGLPAEVTGAFGEFGVFAGRYVITYGSGQRGGYFFTDLAPGTIQIPATQFVRVQAFAQGAGSLFVGASVMPAGILSGSSATFTRVVRTAVDVVVAPDVPRVPFAREISANFCVLSTADNDYPLAELDVQGLRGGLVPVARWRMPAPLVPNPQTMPQFLHNEPIAGPITAFQVGISGLAGVAGVQATACVIQTVRP